MLPWLTEHFGNPHSDSHAPGREAAEALGGAITRIAGHLGLSADNVLITSGATESLNLAIRGVMTHPRCRGRRLVTATTEHPAAVDVARDLQVQGFTVAWVPVQPHGHPEAGQVDLTQLAAAIDDDTALVSIMLANNEMGAVASIPAIASLAHAAGALLHVDATQVVGRLPVDVSSLDIDLLSASAHKFYGPKGIGLLTIGNGRRRVRLRPQTLGGGQQRGLRGGTMNPAGVIAMATALEIATESMAEEPVRVAGLRDHLWDRLAEGVPGVVLQGPSLTSRLDSVNWPARLPGNLNVRLPNIEGEAWMAATPGVAFSSGSACSNIEPLPSHVLLAMGLSESEARRSVRFGIGRTNTLDEIDTAADQLIRAYRKLA